MGFILKLGTVNQQKERKKTKQKKYNKKLYKHIKTVLSKKLQTSYVKKYIYEKSF